MTVVLVVILATYTGWNTRRAVARHLAAPDLFAGVAAWRLLRPHVEGQRAGFVAAVRPKGAAASFFAAQAALLPDVLVRRQGADGRIHTKGFLRDDLWLCNCPPKSPLRHALLDDLEDVASRSGSRLHVEEPVPGRLVLTAVPTIDAARP